MRYMLLVFLGACSYRVLSTFVKLAYDQGFHVGEVTGSQMFFCVQRENGGRGKSLAAKRHYGDRLSRHDGADFSTDVFDGRLPV